MRARILYCQMMHNLQLLRKGLLWGGVASCFSIPFGRHSGGLKERLTLVFELLVHELGHCWSASWPDHTGLRVT